MRWQATFDRLDKISRTRALTSVESALLEKAIGEIDGYREDGPRKGSPWTPEEEARFCDLIADGMAIRAAGRAIGRSSSAGIARFERIKLSMGWQAC